MPYADPPLAGRWCLLDLLGTGGMGSVWRAWDLAEQRFVAVKVLRRRPADPVGEARHDHLVRFVREQALRIAHPHVVAPTAWAADDEQVALAMELVPGGTLADLVADRRGEPWPAAYVAELLGQLLAGLAAVHRAGVVHRDVKPANVLLEATGRGRPHLRLGDFGVAALLGDPGEPDVGTAGWAAPEQLAGAAPDPRQDLYAAGLTARRLLGRAPSALDPLVASLTAADADRRPPDAVEALARLDAAGVRRPLVRPRVPDRVGDLVAAAVPLPPARRRTRPRPAAAPAWLLVGSFVASGAASSAAALILLG